MEVQRFYGQLAAVHSVLQTPQNGRPFAGLAEPTCRHALVHSLQPHPIVSANEGFTHGGGLKLLVVVFDCVSSLLQHGCS